MKNYQIYILCEDGKVLSLIMSGFDKLTEWLNRTSISADNIRWHTIVENPYARTCH